MNLSTFKSKILVLVLKYICQVLVPTLYKYDMSYQTGKQLQGFFGDIILKSILILQFELLNIFGLKKDTVLFRINR